jgi:hypothetical protein
MVCGGGGGDKIHFFAYLLHNFPKQIVGEADKFQGGIIPDPPPPTPTHAPPGRPLYHTSIYAHYDFREAFKKKGLVNNALHCVEKFVFLIDWSRFSLAKSSINFKSDIGRYNIIDIISYHYITFSRILIFFI